MVLGFNTCFLLASIELVEAEVRILATATLWDDMIGKIKTEEKGRVQTEPRCQG